MTSPIRTKPIPSCDKCGGMMVLRRPTRPDQDWDEFWGCSNYPDCKNTMAIDDEGKPISRYYSDYDDGF